MPSRFDVAASGGVGPCFGEPPLPALPLPGGDDELFSPSGNGDFSPSCVADGISPTFEKPILREVEKTIEGTRFVAQHKRNKDKFESVSTFIAADAGSVEPRSIGCSFELCFEQFERRFAPLFIIITLTMFVNRIYIRDAFALYAVKLHDECASFRMANDVKSSSFVIVIAHKHEHICDLQMFANTKHIITSNGVFCFDKFPSNRAHSESHPTTRSLRVATTLRNEYAMA